MTSTLINPFLFGNPVPTDRLVNRTREIRRLAGRIQTGQSSALIGDPRSGKTSLLHYLMDEKKRPELYGEAASSLFFCYLDAYTLSGFNAARFWQFALQPVQRAALDRRGDLLKAYQTCEKEGFTTFVLERLLMQMQANGLRLALLLDEFDVVLCIPELNKAEFYGGLRSLASRYNRALSVLIAARQSVGELNRQTQEFSRNGSPFFNFLEEIVLGQFSAKAAGDLLALDKRFTPAERQALYRLCGGHPYLLQAAASALWDAYQEKEDDPARRLASVQKFLLAQAAPTLADTWRVWTPAARRAFTILALDSAPTLLGERRFDLNALLGTLHENTPEIHFLEQCGYISSDNQLASGWQISAEMMIHWLALELTIALRSNDELGGWLSAQEWDGLFTKAEKAQLVKAASGLGALLKGGVEVFIKAGAEGAAKGMTK